MRIQYRAKAKNSSKRALKSKVSDILHSAPLRRVPKKIHPMLCTLLDAPFDKKGWIFEIKWDGFRALATVQKDKVSLYSRNFKSFNQKFPKIIEALKSLDVDAIFDGEIVALDNKGVSQFQLIQNYKTSPSQKIVYCIFDILYLNGHDLRTLPLLQRKAILETILPKSSSLLRYSKHITEKGVSFFKKAEAKHLEGIIGKDASSSYQTHRSKDWVKIKTKMGQEVVVCGFTKPRNSRTKFGALLVGVYEKGKLRYVGHVGGGFSTESLDAVYLKLKPLIQSKCPFSIPPKGNMPVTWVKPKLLAEVSFSNWTKDGMMRQPIFKGLRSDKKSKQVRKENPLPKEAVNKKKETQDFFTHKDKIFWPKEGYKKGDVLAYYTQIAPYILPYLKDRPMILHRQPNGIVEEGFYQKNVEQKLPKWIKTAVVKHTNRKVNYILVNDLKTLQYVVNLGCIEMHPLNSRIGHLDKPDYFVLDLDPSGADFKHVVEVAKAAHEILEKIGLKSYCKTSGSKGLHIYVPLAAKYPFTVVKEFVIQVALLIHEKLPKTTSLERVPAKRKGKVYIDYLQNNPGQAVAAPYSLRARPHAPIATPLDWKEVKSTLSILDFTLETIFKRIKKKKDPFKPILGRGGNLHKSLLLIEKLK